MLINMMVLKATEGKNPIKKQPNFTLEDFLEVAETLEDIMVVQEIYYLD